MQSKIRPGLTGIVEQRVVSADLVNAKLPEMPAALTSPTMLYYMECAAYKAIKDYLEPGETVLGIRFDFEHLAPTPAGCLITARAEVTDVQDDLVTFAIEANDGHELIGKGTHVRRIVARDRFDKRLNAKRA